MQKSSRAVLYGLHLSWLMERDRLNAHFCRFGCGFITHNGIREALEINEKINQNLNQIQNLLNSHTHIPPPVEQQHLPRSMDH